MTENNSFPLFETSTKSTQVKLLSISETVSLLVKVLAAAQATT